MSYPTNKQISLDVYNNSIVYFNAKQGDAGSRYVEITCTENGKKIVIDKDSAKAYIKFKKADGKYGLNYAEVLSNGNIYFELTQQMLAVSGRARFDVILADAIGELIFNEDSGQIKVTDISIISTICFYVNVLSSTVDDTLIESANEFSGLTNAIAGNIALEKEVRDAEADRQEAEKQREADELIRQGNEEERITTFEKNEETRKDTFEANESERSNTFSDNESTRQSTFETNESERGTTFSNNESTRTSTFEASETERGITFSNNESTRQSTFEASESTRTSTFEASQTERSNTFSNNESTRQSTFEANESERTKIFNENEAKRQDNITGEEYRKANEIKRQDNITGEEYRKANEEARQKVFGKETDTVTDGTMYGVMNETIKLIGEGNSVIEETQVLLGTQDDEAGTNTLYGIKKELEATISESDKVSKRAEEAAQKCEDVVAGTGIVFTSDIVNNLTTTEEGKVLDATQGTELFAMITALQETIANMPQVYTGTTDPDNSLGNNGDYYLKLLEE